jgi:hypothetical protein
VNRLARWLERIGAAEGSTRSAALLRIGTPLVLWHRHYGPHLFFQSVDGPVHALFSIVFFVGPALMLVGLASRWAAAATALALVSWNVRSIALLHEPRPIEWFVTYLFVGLAFTDCGRSFSLDRALAVRRALREGRPPPPERGAVWGLLIICVHLSALYLFVAIDKSDLAWLRGDRMLRYYLHFYGTSDGGNGFALRTAMAAMAIGVTTLEYALAVGLWLRVGRRYLLAPALVMNLGFFFLIPGGSIVWHTCLAYLAYFPPDEFHEFVERQVGHVRAPPG